MEKFDLNSLQRKGASKAIVGSIIGLVISLILIANTAPSALVGLFNTSAFTTNGTAGFSTGVPAWVPTVLGVIGALAFVLFMWKIAE